MLSETVVKIILDGPENWMSFFKVFLSVLTFFSFKNRFFIRSVRDFFVGTQEMVGRNLASLMELHNRLYKIDSVVFGAPIEICFSRQILWYGPTYEGKFTFRDSYEQYCW